MICCRDLDEYKVEVHGQGLKVSSAEDTLLQDVQFNDARLLPSTCHSLQWSHTDGLHFRIQIDGTSQYSPPLDKSRREMNQAEEKCCTLLKASPVTCLCVRCGYPIIHEVR